MPEKPDMQNLARARPGPMKNKENMVSSLALRDKKGVILGQAGSGLCVNYLIF